MSHNQLLLIGGGGHCKSCIDVIQSSGGWRIEGIIDQPDRVNRKLCGYPVIGSDDDLPKYVAHQTYSFLVTIGQIKSSINRKRLFHTIDEIGGILPIIRASTAYVSSGAMIGRGSIIMHLAFLNCGVSVGVNAIINTGAVLEHDVIVGDHCHVSTKSICNGNVRIGNECFIGSGTIIAQSISICDGCIIGAGSVVVKNLTEPGIYFGNPAQRME